MEYLIFCSDGIIRAKLNDKQPALPLSFLKEQKSISEIRFMSYWLSKKVIFEKGLTVGLFLNSLEYFADYLNEYLGKDIKSYILESKKLISIESRKDFNWITLYHQYTLSEQNEYTVEKERMLNNKWKVYDNYMLSAYKKNDTEYYSIEKYPIQKIQHVPLFLDNESRIIINQKDIENFNKEQSLINTKAFGVIHQNIEENYNIDYLLINKEHTFSNVIEGFFKYFNKNIESREKEIEMLESIYEDLELDKENEGIQLKVHGGSLQQAITEVQEKEMIWDDLVHKAVKENTVVRIGKVQEGILPEKRLFGKNITEPIRRIKLK